MIKIVTAILAAGTMAVSLPTGAAAARWQSINQRQANLNLRIDVGVRDGSLTRNEASRLRTQFANIQRLEWRYRRNGLSNWERNDLDRRFDNLSARIKVQRHDRRYRHRR
ncbi:MAG: hypothetical protein ABI810_20325 [Sphingomonas bacterium]